MRVVMFREERLDKKKELKRVVERLADEFLYEDKDIFNKLDDSQKINMVAAVIDATDLLDRHCWLTENIGLDTALYLFTKALRSCKQEDEKEFFEQVKEMAFTYHKNSIDDILDERNHIS